MKERHKPLVNTEQNIDSKEGQRTGLCRNNLGTRCSSLDFTEDEIDNFIQLGIVLKGIHTRLAMEEKFNEIK